MSDRLPVHVDPVAFCERGREMAGHVPLAAFSRLASALESTEGEIEVVLRFGRDDGGRLALEGHVRGSLPLQCQRCLASYSLEVDAPVALVLVESEAEADALPEELDALVVGGQRSMHTVDMIEDELILALPIVPRCGDEAACRPAVELLDSEALEAGEEPTERQRPFAELGDEH